MRKMTELEISKAAEKEINIPITLAFMEHQLDFVTKLVISLADRVSDLNDEEKMIVESMKATIQHSSVDFQNMDHPYESYKVPAMVKQKSDTRLLNKRYLDAKVRNGVF